MKMKITNDKLQSLLENIVNDRSLDLVVCGSSSDCRRQLVKYLISLSNKHDKIVVIENSCTLGLSGIFPEKDISELKVGYDVGYREALKTSLNLNSNVIITKVDGTDTGVRGVLKLNDIGVRFVFILDESNINKVIGNLSEKMGIDDYDIKSRLDVIISSENFEIGNITSLIENKLVTLYDSQNGVVGDIGGSYER